MSVPAESIFFDLWSRTYDRPGLQHATYRPIHDAVMSRLAGLQPERILDLGCGTGLLTERLSESFPDALVVGVDLSDGMIGKAADRLVDDHTSGFVRADAQHVPIATDSFDVVTCTESFHWYADQAAAAAELARLIRPGGRVMIASVAAVTAFADDAIQRATALAGRPVKAIPKRQLRQLLEDAGFDVHHQGRIPRLGFVPWPVLTDATRRRSS
jgi:ubiquinone/menaquinone biosynthesis C-methylase UbiE